MNEKVEKFSNYIVHSLIYEILRSLQIYMYIRIMWYSSVVT